MWYFFFQIEDRHFGTLFVNKGNQSLRYAMDAWLCRYGSMLIRLWYESYHKFCTKFTAGKLNIYGGGQPVLFVAIGGRSNRANVLWKWSNSVDIPEEDAWYA